MDKISNVRSYSFVWKPATNAIEAAATGTPLTRTTDGATDSCSE